MANICQITDLVYSFFLFFLFFYFFLLSKTQDVDQAPLGNMQKLRTERPS